MYAAASKLLWTLLNPGSLLALCLLFGAVTAWLPWRRPRRLGRAVLATGVTVNRSFTRRCHFAARCAVSGAMAEESGRNRGGRRVAGEQGSPDGAVA
jgi:hypothetical protein